jgi:hypothetical protein
MEASGQLHAPAALPPGKEPLYPLKSKVDLKCSSRHPPSLDAIYMTKLFLNVNSRRLQLAQNITFHTVSYKGVP